MGFGFWVLPDVNFSNPAGVPIVFLPFIFIAFFGGVFPLLIWWQTKRAFSNPKDFQKNVRYTFLASGFDAQDGKSSSSLSWDSVYKAIETKRSFNIFIYKSLFYVVPKRCIQQQEDVAKLRKILKQGLGNKAKVREISAAS